jgi:hypothetical protein
MEPITLHTSPAQLAEWQARRAALPWACVRLGALTLIVTLVTYQLVRHWGARFPAIEWTLPLTASLLLALVTWLSTAPRTLQFAATELITTQHQGGWMPAGHIPWTAIRSWSYSQRWPGSPTVILTLRLSYFRQIRIPVDASQCEQIDGLLRSFLRR